MNKTVSTASLAKATAAEPRSTTFSYRLLEPRMVFDAAMAATVDHAHHAYEAALGAAAPATALPEAHGWIAVPKDTMSVSLIGFDTAAADAGKSSGQVIVCALPKEAVGAGIGYREPQVLPSPALADTAAKQTASPAAEPQILPGAHVDLAKATASPAPQVLPRAETIVFVDPGVQNYQAILHDVPAGAQIVVLDATTDGLDQIAAYLASHHDVAAIHILSHGASGEMTLGGAVINADTLAAHRADFAAIGEALRPGGDILIYGCDVASGANGARFIDAIAKLTGDDVAASTDATGAADLGGNWDLEYRTGTIDVAAIKVTSWEGLLALSNSGTWTIGTNTATTTTDGVTITITFTNGGASTWTSLANDTLNTPAGGLSSTAFSNNASGAPSLSTTWNAANTTDVGTVTITFSQPVINPIIDIDRLGGSANGVSNSSLWTLTSGGSLTRLSGTTEFKVTSTTITETTGLASPGAESNDSIANGSSAGSVRVNGTFSSITFAVQMNPSASAGIGDLVELNVAVDAPPHAANDTISVNEDTTLNGNLYADNGAGVDSDPRGDTLTTTQVNGAAYTVGVPIALANGTLTITNATTGTFTFVPNANFHGTQAFTYTIADANGGTSTATATIDVLSVNDAPAGTDHIASINEDTPYTFAAADFGFTDPIDSPANTLQSVVITTLPNAVDGVLRLSGVAVIAGQELTASQIAQLTFTPAANVNGANLGAFTFQVRDNGGTANGGIDLDPSPNAFKFNVAAVNDPPVLDLNASTAGAGHVTTFTENGQPVAITNTNATITDVDNTTMSSATIVLTNRQAGDVLALGTLPTGVQYALDTSDPARITLTLTGSASLASYQTAIQSVTFTNSTDSPSPADRTINVTVNDGSADSNVATSTIHVVPVNDAPIIAQAFTVYAATPGVSDATFSNGTITNGQTSANVTHTRYVDIPAGTTLGTLTAVIDLNYFDNSGTVVVNGTNIIPAGAFEAENQVNPGETRITFADGSYSTTPWLANTNGLPRFEIVITNGSVEIWGTRTTTATVLEKMTLASGTFNQPTLTIGTNTIQFVNLDGGGPDASAGTIKVLGNLTTPPQVVAEDTPIVFSAANGNAINFSDVDAGPSGSETVTLTVAHGTLNLATTAGLSGLSGNGTGSVTFNGTIAQINAAVAGLKYTNTPDYNGTDSLTVTLRDDGRDNGTATSNGALSATPKVIPITITPVADIVPDTVSTLEDTAISFNVLTGTNGASADSFEGTPAVTAITQPANGTVTFAADGTMTFTPNANFNGTTSFNYTVTSGGVTETATVTVNVAAVNDAPVSTLPTTQTVAEDTTLVFSSANANAITIADVDAGASGLETVSLSVAHGTLNLGSTAGLAGLTGNGTATIAFTGTLAQVNAAVAGLSYRGDLNYNGPDQLTVRVTDDGRDNGTLTANGAQSAVIKTVAINVTPVNDPPVAVADSYTVNEKTLLTVPIGTGLLGNDTDIDTAHAALTVTLINGASYTPGAAIVLSSGAVLRPNADGTFSYDPNGKFNTLAAGQTATDSFTYQVSDGLGGFATATATIVVVGVNDAPVAVADSYATGEKSVLNVPVGTGLLANDTDVDTAHNLLTVTGVNGNAISSGAPITLPSGAILTQNSDGTFAYNPNGAFNALAAGQTATDSFTYQVADGKGGVATATATVTIAGVNDAPVAVADTNSTDPRSAISTDAAHGVLSNDSDVDTAHNQLVVTTITNGTTSVAAGSAITGTNGGTFVIAADGSYSFDPGTAFDALPPGSTALTSVTYAVSDGHGGTATATLTVSVPYENLPPFLVRPLSQQASADGNTVSIPLAPAFSDPNPADQGHLTIMATGLPPGLSVDPSGTIVGTLTADASQHAGPYQVTVTATDPSGSRVSTTFQFQVDNPAPVAVADTNTVLEHATTTGNVVSNDHDGGNDHDALTVTQVNGAPYVAGSVITLASGAQLVMAADGSYTYDTHRAFDGLAVGQTATDAFSYQISDGQGGFATATATITITGQNDTPVVIDPARPGTAPADPNHVVPAQSGQDGTAITPLTVSGFFRDPDNADTLTLSVTGTLPPGITFDAATGTFSGTPSAGASQGGPAGNGVYQVLVNAADGHGGTVSTTVSFAISNPPPIAQNDTNTVAEHDTTSGNVIANDHDGGGDTDPLAVVTVNDRSLVPGAMITLPSGAHLMMAADGAYTYDPAGVFAALSASQSATDSFTYTISDGQGGTATATATIIIQGQNDAPVAAQDVNTTNPQVVVSTDAAHGVLSNDTDAEHDTLTVTGVAVGAVSVAAGQPIAGSGGGTFIIAADGSYSFDPGHAFDALTPGQSATTSVTYSISDGQGGVSSTTLTVTVPYDNLPPVVQQPIPAQTSADGNTVSLPLDGVFADPNPGDTLTITATGLPPGLTYNAATGAIEGTLAADASQHGGIPYTVILTADDGHGGTTTSTFDFQISNPAPVAADDMNTVAEHATTTGAVLTNDHDGGGDSDTLTVSQVNGQAYTAGQQITLPSGAHLVMAANGTYGYDRAGAFNGLSVGQTATDSFTYQVADGQGGVATATVTITITGQNEAPVVVDPAHPGQSPADPAHVVPVQTGQDGSAVTPLVVSGFFADADRADTLTFSVQAAQLPPGVAFDPATGTFAGTASADASQGGNAGPGLYDVTVTAADGHGGTASTIVRFAITNPSPVANPDPNTVAEHATTTGAVLANDHDGGSDTDALTVTQVNGATITSGATVALPSGALLVMRTDGTYSYDPNGAFAYLQAGQSVADRFVYQVSDGQGGFATATVTIVITGQNDNPVANVDVNTVEPEASLAVLATVGVLSNDTDPEHDALTVTAVGNGTTTVAPGTAIAGTAGGTFTINPDGSYTFDAGHDFDSLLPGTQASTAVTYQVTDGHGGTAQTTLTISVPYADLPPVVHQPVPAQTSQDGTTISLDLSNVFRDPNPGDQLTITATGLPTGLVYNPATHAIEGTLSSDASQHAGPWTVTLGARDPSGNVVSTTFDFTVTNPPPVAVDDTNTVAEHATITTASVSANDHDGGNDHDPLTVTMLNGTPFTSGTPITLPSGAVLTLQTDGTYAYDPNGAFNGLGVNETATDSFTYKISDGQGGTSTATVSITITGTNDAPVVVDPAHPGQPVAPGQQVVATQFAADGSPIVPLDVTNVFADPDRHDTLTLSVPAGQLPPGVTFDPATGTFSGTLTASASQGGPNGDGTYPVTVTASDGHGGTVSTTVVFEVANPAPVATPDTATVSEHGATTGNVLANDHDGGADTDPLTVTQVNATPLVPGATITLPSGAHLVIAADGTYGYDTNGAFDGLGQGQTATDSFTYQVADGQGGFATATATITITGQNDAPVVVDPAHPGTPPADPDHVVATVSANDGTTIAPLDVTAFFHDPDRADTVTLTVPAGTLPPGLTFDPASGTFSGTLAPDASQGGPGADGTYPVTVTATDSHGATVSTIVTFTIANTPPVAVADTATAPEHGTATGNLLANDHDGGLDTDPVAATGVVNANGTVVPAGQPLILPSGAHLTLNGDGTYVYDPNGVFQSLSVGETGTDTFSYQITDGQGGTATATVSITITGQNDAPIVVDPATGDPVAPGANVIPSQSGQDGATITPLDVHTYFRDPDTGDTLTLSVPAATLPPGITFDPATGTFSGTPASDASQGGPGNNGVYPVTVTATDNHGATVSTVVTFTFSNPPPVAVDDTLSVPAGQTGTGTVLTNDHDGGFDLDPLAVTEVNGTAINATGTTTLTLPSGAILTIQPDGTYGYDPNGLGVTLGHGQSTTDQFTYQVADGNGGFDTATVHITINAANAPPVVIDPAHPGTPPADPMNVVPPLTGSDGSPLPQTSVASYFTDPNQGDVLTFSVPAGSLPPGVTFDPTSGTFAGTPTASASQGGPAHDGTYPVVVTASDGYGGTVSTVVTIAIGNVAPVANDDGLTVPVHGVAGTGNVLANDHDGGGDTDPLTVSQIDGASYTPGTPITLPSGALLTMNANGSYSYDPSRTHPGLGVNETATDSFTYQVSDGNGGFATATVSITITGINERPVVVDPANPGTLPADPDHVVPVQSAQDGSPFTSPDIRTYFADPNTSDTLTLSVPAGQLPPGVTFDPATGTFSGTLTASASQGGPNGDGTYPVTVTASDGHGGTVSTTVVFEVANPAPVATPDTATVSEHGATTGNVLANDHDGGADTDPLTVTQVNATPLVPGATITLPSGAHLVIAADGTYGYDTNGAFDGLGQGQTATDSFTYQVADGQGGFATATATITITGQNDAPVVVDPAHPGTPPADPDHVVATVSANDGTTIAPLDVTAFFHDPDRADTVTLTVPAGTLPPGLTFDPASGTFSGTLAPDASQGGPGADGTYPVTVTATDSHGATVSTIVTFTIANTPPVAVDDTATAPEHGTATGNLLANDHDGGLDTDPLAVTLVDGAPYTPGTAITLPSGALLVMHTDGTYSYDPAGHFDGLGQGATAHDSFTYQISDGNGGTATATVSITITGQNDAPIVVDPAHPGVPVSPGQPVVAPVAGADGTPIAPLTIANVFHDPDAHDTLTFSVDPATLPPGLVFDPATGTFSGTPTSNASQGGLDGTGTYPIVVTASDGHGGTVSTVVTFTFSNPPPVAVDDTLSVPAGQTGTGTVLTNDHDGGFDLDPLAVTEVNGTAINATGTTTLTLPSGAILTIQPDGTYGYDPNGLGVTLGHGQSTTDQFTYQVADGNGGFDTATVHITINAANAPPVVIDPAHPGTPPADPMNVVPPLTGSDGSPLPQTSVASYFTDPNQGDVLTFSVPAGSLPPGVTFDPTSGTFAGTPTASASQGGPAHDGTYPVVVTASDGYGGTVSTVVTIAIGNVAPVANDDGLTVPVHGVAGTGNVLANDHDGGGDTDPLTVSQIDGASYTPGTPITLPSGALLTMNANGSYSYDPSGTHPGLGVNETATDSFTYQVSDGNGGFATATVSITITGINERPVVVDPANPGTLPADPDHVVPVQSAQDGSPFTSPDIRTYFADPNTSDTLTLSVPAGQLPPGVTFDPATGTFSGTLTASASQGGPNGDGTYPVTVTASDGHGGTVSTTVVFEVANPAPVATPDTATVSEHGATTGNVLANDHDGGADTDPLTVTQVNATPLVPGATITLPSGAHLVMAADGTYGYDTNGAFDGLGQGQTATDSFTYQVADGQGGFATATATITITGQNDAPVVVDPAHPGTPPADPDHVVATVSANDGTTIAPLDVTAFFHDPDRADTVTLTVPAGTLPPGLTFDHASGTFSGTLAPDASQGGPGADGTYPVTVTATDSHGATVSTIVTFTIANTPPVAVADTATAPEHGTATGNLLANDHDGGLDTDPLAATGVVNANGTVVPAGQPLILPSGAHLTLNGDGTYVYDPNGVFQSLSVGETGTDTFSYQITDGQGGTATATVSITITGQNDAPIVVDPAHPGVPVPPGQPVVAPVAGADGTPIAPLTIANVFHDPDAHDTLTFSVDPATLPPGLVFDPATGTFSGTPTSNASQGGLDGTGTYPIVVTASDGHGGTVSTVVTFTFSNPPPVAVDDIATTQPGDTVTIPVLANDHDGGHDHDTLTVVSATTTSGAVTINPDGTLDFTPAPGFVGPATITYTISDGQGGTSTATVQVLVAPNVHVPQPQPPATPPQSPIEPSNGGLSADGAVIAAVNGETDLGQIVYTTDPGFNPKVTATGIVDATVNAISNLGGFHAARNGHGERLDTEPVWRLQSLLQEEFGRTSQTWNPDGLTGFSLRFTIAADPHSESRSQIILDSIVRDRTLIVNLSSTSIPDHAHVVEYRVMQADGRPLPGWLDLTGGTVLIGEHPADIELVKLHVTAVLSDGTTVERDVVIRTNSGEIQPLEGIRRSEFAPLFNEQLTRLADASDDAFERLLLALAG